MSYLKYLVNMLKFITEFAPLMAFFIGYRYGGVQKATIYMLITSIISLFSYYLINRKVQRSSLISASLSLISAAVTLITGNPVFIKLKPTIVYMGLAASCYVSARKGKPLIKYMLANINLQESGWLTLSYRFAAFFLAMATVNEIVWRNCQENTWVKFKVFGTLPLSILFILLQLPLLMKNKLPQK